jgi:Phage terminase, small subunit.
MPGTSSSGGRNARSRAEHKLAGTLRGDRHGTATDPQPPDPPKGRPHRPSTLRGHALAEWNRMVVRLEASKTLSTVDDAALYQYVCLFAETEAILTARRENAALVKKLLAAVTRIESSLKELAAADRVAETVTVVDVGDLTEAIAQVVKLRQLDTKLTTQLRQGHMAVRQYLVEFGMTPAARSRVKVPTTPETKDPFAEFDDPPTAH